MNYNKLIVGSMIVFSVLYIFSSAEKIEPEIIKPTAEIDVDYAHTYNTDNLKVSGTKTKENALLAAFNMSEMVGLKKEALQISISIRNINTRYGKVLRKINENDSEWLSVWLEDYVEWIKDDYTTLVSSNATQEQLKIEYKVDELDELYKAFKNRKGIK